MKIEFNSLEDLYKWLHDKTNKYEVYCVGDTNEVVAMPKVSTRPVKIGVAPFGNKKAKEIIEEINKRLPEIVTFMVSGIDFAVEK